MGSQRPWLGTLCPRPPVEATVSPGTESGHSWLLENADSDRAREVGGSVRREATAPVPRREGARPRGRSPDVLARSWSAPTSPTHTFVDLSWGSEHTGAGCVAGGAAREKQTSPSLSPFWTLTQTPPPPRPRPPPGARRTPLPPPLPSRSDYGCKHWAAAPAREGVVWKRFKNSVTLGVGAQKPGPLPLLGGRCGDARGARPSQAQAGVQAFRSSEPPKRDLQTSRAQT